MSQRHRVFISFHHANDENYKKIFELRFGNAFDILVSAAVEFGDIDPSTNTERIRQRIRDEHLRDSTVTVVLVGLETWQRKHVDWEIYSSLRHTAVNRRSGLVGVLLPSFSSRYGGVKNYASNKYVLPPRLADNIDSGFAKLHEWSEDPSLVQARIHEAFRRRDQEPPPNNAREMFARNRTGERWFP